MRIVITTSNLEPLLQPLESARSLSIKDTGRLADAGIEPSVGSVGDSYDNALAETINGPCKAEVIHRRGSWRSFETVEYATLEWGNWFNNRRLLQPIGNIPPVEAEQRYYAMLDEPAMATYKPKLSGLRQSRGGSCFKESKKLRSVNDERTRIQDMARARRRSNGSGTQFVG